MSIFPLPLLLVFFSFLLCPVASLPGANGPPKEVKSGHCTFWNGRYVTAKLIETKVAKFELTEKELGFYDNQGNLVLEKGEFEVYVGSNSQTQNKKSFKL